MVHKYQKVSDYGTSTPIVARTFLQGAEFLRFLSIPQDNGEALKGVLWGLQQQLLRCYSIRNEINAHILRAHLEFDQNGLEVQGGGHVVSLPGVPDLETKAESFLQASKGAIRETARIFEAVYGTAQDHRFHKLAEWAEKQFGAGSEITADIRAIEPWVKSIVDMRNAVDHPVDAPKGKLVVSNFQLDERPPRYSLTDPSWNLFGEAQEEMVPNMDIIIKTILETSESFQIHVFGEFRSAPFLNILEIPEEKRDPSFPIRFKVAPALWPFST